MTRDPQDLSRNSGAATPVSTGGPAAGCGARRRRAGARRERSSMTSTAATTTATATSQTDLLTGHALNAIFPTMRLPEMGPKYRLSSESVRLSPITK